MAQTGSETKRSRSVDSVTDLVVKVPRKVVLAPHEAFDPHRQRLQHQLIAPGQHFKLSALVGRDLHGVREARVRVETRVLHPREVGHVCHELHKG